jgi:hypothetical protein
MQTFLPSSPPTASPPLGSYGVERTRYNASPSPCQSVASEADEPYFRQANGTAVNGTNTAGKNGKRRPSAIPRPGGGGKSHQSSPESQRKGSLVPPSDSEDGGGEKWETLQVGTPTTSSFPAVGNGGRGRKTPSPSPARTAILNGNGKALFSAGSSPPSAAQARKASIPAQPSSSSPMARAKTVDFPPSSSSSTSSPTTRLRRPSVGTPSKPSSISTSSPQSTSNGSPANPRKRAVTASSTSQLANGSSPSTTSRAPLRPTQLQPRPTKSSQSRTPLPGQPPVRRKSLSTAQELAALRARAGVDEVTGLPLVTGSQPEWGNDPAPLVYRTSKGDLAFASSAAEDLRRLRPEDRVLPAVARRLEAERVAALARELGTAGEREDGGEMLVNEWGKDGTPRSAVSWNSKTRSSASGQGGGSAVPSSPVPMEEVETTSTPPDEPPLERGQYPPLPSPAPSHPTPPSRTPSSPSRQPSQYKHESPRRRPSQQVSLSPLPPTPSQPITLNSSDVREQQQNGAASVQGEKAGKTEPSRLVRQEQLENDAKGAGCCRCVIS